MDLNSFALFGMPHLAYFGIALPYRTWRNRKVWSKSDAPPRTRLQHYTVNLQHFRNCGLLSLSAAFLLWRFTPGAPAATNVFVLGRVASSPAEVWLGLFPLELPSLTSVLIGVIAYAVMVSADLWYSRRCFDRGDAHMYFAAPQTQPERKKWVAVSVGAGITEELTWRAVQPEIIAQLTGHLWPAVLICAATFGIGHVRQGKLFVLLAALFAFVFHVLTRVTGSLYIPILVHIAMNITVGLRAGRWSKA